MNNMNLKDFFNLNLSLLKNNNNDIIKDFENIFINSTFEEKKELFNENPDFYYKIILNLKNKNIIVEFINYLEEKKELMKVFLSYSNILINYFEYIPNKIIFLKRFLDEELFYLLDTNISKKIYDYIINNNNILLLLLNNDKNIKSLLIFSDLLFIYNIEEYQEFYKFIKFIIVFLIENNKVNLFSLDEFKKVIDNNRKLVGIKSEDIKKHYKLLLDKNRKIINIYYYYNLLFLYLLNNENISDTFLNQIKIDIINNNNMQNFYIKLCDSNLEITLLILIYHKNINSNLSKIVILNMIRYILFCNEKKLEELEPLYKKEILKIFKQYKIIIKKELNNKEMIMKFNDKIKYIKG